MINSAFFLFQSIGVGNEFQVCEILTTRSFGPHWWQFWRRSDDEEEEVTRSFTFINGTVQPLLTVNNLQEF